MKIIGDFKIELIEDDKVIQKYEEKNQIMNPIFNWTSRTVYGGGLWKPKIEDFMIHCVVLGTDGVDEFNNPKKINPWRDNLFSEENFWENSYDQKKSFLYQATFKQPDTLDEHYAEKLNEGPNIPDITQYRGRAFNDPKYKEAGLFIKRSYDHQTIRQEIYLGKFAGNGPASWNGVDYSEAALYLTRGATELGDKLGTIFSMKTFPKMKKTDSCIIKITWDILFKP